MTNSKLQSRWIAAKEIASINPYGEPVVLLQSNMAQMMQKVNAVNC
jgi:hypothetical protein